MVRSNRSLPYPGIEPPQLPARPSPGSLPDEQLENLAVYKGMLLSSCDLSGQDVEDVTFEGALLRHVILSGTRLPSLQLYDVRLDACDLAEADWEKASLNRVEAIGCRMVGWRSSQALIRNVVIKGCSAIGAQFWSTTFKNVRFESCTLRDADFQRADLRGSKIEGVRLGIKELQGLILDVEQAIAIARMLGAVVKLD